MKKNSHPHKKFPNAAQEFSFTFASTTVTRATAFICLLMCFAFIFSTRSFVSAASVDLVLSPEKVIQGEPVMVKIDGVTDLGQIKNLYLNDKKLKPFLFQARPVALIGIDINKAPGEYKVNLELQNGEKISKALTIEKRPKEEAPLGIPDKLGGNTPAAATSLVSTLSKENALLASIWTGQKSFWTEKFRFPLPDIFITDPYGYSRQTGSYSIAHKGTDLRAKEKTPVMAMNRGVVRIARSFTVYGNAIVVDHGLGLMTMYMHLSKILVNPGELVLPGQVIGYSGQTGYAESPHLHMSVRIDGVSIDPMKFMEFFK